MEEPSPFVEVLHPKRRAYLTSLVEAGGNVTRACELAQVHRTAPYSRPWKEDEAFQAALPLAQAMAADHLEAEAKRRAYEGVTEPVGWYKGEPGGYVTRYSDTLMIFLLKGAKPEKYVKPEKAGMSPEEFAAHAMAAAQAMKMSLGADADD